MIFAYLCCKVISFLLYGEAALDVVDDELCGALDAQQAGVQAQVVALGVAPQLVGVEVVVLGAQFCWMAFS
jgi:hypothetical protein